MTKADYSQKPLITQILTDSFLDNKSIRYVVKQDQKRVQRTQSLIEYSFNICSRFGEIWLSDDQQGCALVLLPDKKKTTLQSMLWDAKLATSVIGLPRVMKVMDREGKVKKNHPMDPFAYLWYVGVNPDHQGQGTGTKLLRDILDEYDGRNRPVYLETSTLRNIPWYEDHGFEVYKKLFFTYELFMLRRVLSTD